MPILPDLKLHAVVYREGDWWIAQCLEYDLVTAQRQLNDIPGELQRVVNLLVSASHERGIEPFYGYSEAPRRFWRMYDEASEWPGQSPSESGQSSSVAIDARLAA